jgi:hypothetical protein
MKALALGMSVVLTGTCHTARAAEPTSAEIRAIAKEAYIYGYPKPEALNGRWIPPKAQPAQTDNALPTKP